MNMFLTERDVAANVGSLPQTLDLNGMGDDGVMTDNMETSAFGMNPMVESSMIDAQMNMGAFYNDWLFYIKNNPVKVAIATVGAIGLVVGLILLLRKKG